MNPNSAAPARLTLPLARAGLVQTLLVLGLLALLTAGCGKEKLAPLPRDALLLVVGDSISAGFGIDPAQAWPQLLAQRSGWRVVNGGVNGDLSADALSRLPGLLEQHAPQLVLLEIGGNDMLRGVADARIRGNIEQMVAAAKGRGAQVVLMAVPRPSLMGAALSALKPADFYLAIADGMSIPLLEDALSDVLSSQDFKLDPLHPNAAGHEALARKVGAELRALGLLEEEASPRGPPQR